MFFILFIVDRYLFPLLGDDWRALATPGKVLTLFFRRIVDFPLTEGHQLYWLLHLKASDWHD